MNVLVGIDFSRDSKGAIRFLSGIQFPSGTDISLAHVIKGSKELHDMCQSVDLEKGIRSVRHQSRAHAMKHFHRLQQVLSQANLTFHPVVREGNPGEELEFLSTKGRKDLVVVGTRGLTGIKRFLLGSVSERVLHHAPCSVLIVRGQARWSQRGLRILMAVDNSVEAERALQFINQWQFPANSELVLFHVVEPFDYRVVQDNYGIVKLGEQAHVSLEKFEKDRLRRLDHSRKVLLQGARKNMNIKKAKEESIPAGVAAEEILKAARRFRSDLIVLGARNLAGLNRTFLGSISQKVVRHASCSVLVVRKLPKECTVRL